MSESTASKLPIFNTIALWVLVLSVVAWLCFKPESKLDKDTINSLTVAVEKFSVASENMAGAAKAQREWANNLQNAYSERGQQREAEYDDLYKKYDYNQQDGNVNLADLYNVRMQQPAQGVSGRDVHRDENGASKTPALPSATDKPKGQPH